MKTAQLKLLYKLLARFARTGGVSWEDRDAITQILRNVGTELSNRENVKHAAATASEIPF